MTNFDFTADVVELEGRPEAKVGRSRWDNPLLTRVEWSRLSELDRGASP